MLTNDPSPFSGRIGSPIKTQGGKKMAATAVIDPSTSKIIGTAYVDQEAVDFSSFGADSTIYFVERSLESIEERTTESEDESDNEDKEAASKKAAEEEKVLLQRRLSGPKSFEMEDLSGGGQRGPPSLKGKRRRNPVAPPKSAAAVLEDNGKRHSASRDRIL